MTARTTTVVTVTDAALGAAEHLSKTLRLLNAAGDGFDYDVEHQPYGATQRALRLTLAAMLEDPSKTGDPEHDAVIEQRARDIIEGTVSNGENVQFQITYLLGFEMVVITPGHGEQRIPAGQ